MAFRRKYNLALYVKASIGAGTVARPVIRANVVLKLAWDNSGRQLWECEGWQLPGQREIVHWDDRTNPMTAAIHALACAYLTAEVIAEIIATLSQDVGNVIDLEAQRELRGIERPLSVRTGNRIRAHDSFIALPAHD
ncbi:MAG: hypothetical protein APF80_07770 [Alphaproteobacteria bacterium BRH_c36]|nr:MAG: hypothetical protein APF80_07770 [Alphaproteobacteria bacterium BRH_c36]